jgi:hypothetical protein
VPSCPPRLLLSQFLNSLTWPSLTSPASFPTPICLCICLLYDRALSVCQAHKRYSHERHTTYRYGNQSFLERPSVIATQNVICRPVASILPRRKKSNPSPDSLHRHTHFYSQVSSYAHQR